ncbi:3-oxoacyl-ACP synthase [Mycobacterium sp. IS-1742]|uniref:3-oxoacyl-[acyl-carrier-protein] synthase III C-terminal domain-containing protein n=1 Tax=Mycobacterium sp. IS-1742 TaxID=1772285 RepID=UPI00074015B7|nr:3-oxoacyl-[acyl-carrier-protein] synthase III C-terminal domain-containing protein [Mycobacterium sp. IS-1742]KUI30357.1 3-oxoacyl-ACP synthase [Mycobacterium sp. IS-1742]
MGTIIDQVAVTRGGWRDRHSALHLAVAAARSCLDAARRDPDDLSLLVNAGIYRDKNLGEPALAALIQEDIGANPEDPHDGLRDGAHGTFSFDISNGSCGVLTGLQVVDGFLRSRAATHALITAGDADPGRGMSRHFPFSPVGAALLCDWTDDDSGLGRVSWVSDPDDGKSFRATVGSADARNVLRFTESGDLDDRLAEAAAHAARICLDDAGLRVPDVDVVVAAPGRPDYAAALAERLDLGAGRIVVADDENAHTASLAAALKGALTDLPPGALILIVAAGAGITAGAALYRAPGRSESDRRSR